MIGRAKGAEEGLCVAGECFGDLDEIGTVKIPRAIARAGAQTNGGIDRVECLAELLCEVKNGVPLRLQPCITVWILFTRKDELLEILTRDLLAKSLDL